MAATHGRLDRDARVSFGAVGQGRGEFRQLFVIGLVVIDLQVEHPTKSLHRAVVPGVHRLQRDPATVCRLEGEVDRRF